MKMRSIATTIAGIGLSWSTIVLRDVPVGSSREGACVKSASVAPRSGPSSKRLPQTPSQRLMIVQAVGDSCAANSQRYVRHPDAAADGRSVDAPGVVDDRRSVPAHAD